MELVLVPQSKFSGKLFLNLFIRHCLTFSLRGEKEGKRKGGKRKEQEEVKKTEERGQGGPKYNLTVAHYGIQYFKDSFLVELRNPMRITSFTTQCMDGH